MATTLLLLVSMATVSCGPTTLSTMTTRIDRGEDVGSKTDMTNAVDYNVLHNARKPGLTAIFISGEEIDINHLDEQKIGHVAGIVEALEELNILEKSQDMCYTLAKIVRHKPSDNKWLVDISFVINANKKKIPPSNKDAGCLSHKQRRTDNSSDVSYTYVITDDDASYNASQGESLTSEPGLDDDRGLSRTQTTVITTCSIVIGLFFAVAVILRIRNHVKRKKENEALARRPTFRSCSMSLRSQNENSGSRHAIKDDEANMTMIDKEEGVESPNKSPVNHSNRYLPLVNSCSAPSTPRNSGYYEFAKEKYQIKNDAKKNDVTSPNQCKAPDVGKEDLENSSVALLQCQMAVGVTCEKTTPSVRVLKPEVLSESPPEVPPRVPLRGPPRLAPLRKVPEPEGDKVHGPPLGSSTPRPCRLDMGPQANGQKRHEVILHPTQSMNIAISKQDASPSNSISSLGNISFGNKKAYQRLDNTLQSPDCENCVLSPISPHSSSVLSPGTVSTEVETPCTIENSPVESIVSPVPVSFQNPAYSIITSPEAVSNGVAANGNGRGLMQHFREYLKGTNMQEFDDISLCSPCSDRQSQTTLDEKTTCFFDNQSLDSVASEKVTPYFESRSLGSAASEKTTSYFDNRSLDSVASANSASEQLRELYKDHMREANGLDDVDSSEEMENASTSLLDKTHKSHENGTTTENSFLLGPDFDGMEPTYV